MSTTPFDTMITVSFAAISDFARSIGMQAYLRADGRGGHEIVLVSPSRYMPSADSEQPAKPNPQAATVAWTGDTVRIEQGGGVVRYAKLLTDENAQTGGLQRIVDLERELVRTQNWYAEFRSRVDGQAPSIGEALIGRRFTLTEAEFVAK